MNASNSGGGLFGQLSINSNSSFQISNSYNIVPIIGNITGGLIGEIIFNVSSNSNLNISNCYSSSPIFRFGVSSIVGLAVGCISPQATNFTFFSQVFCNNQTNNSLPLIGNGSFSNSSTIESLSCSQLYFKVNSSFSHAIWGGDKLLIEPRYSYGMCNCCFVTLLPSTLPPSTFLSQTTLSFTTSLSTSQQPSTNQPTTNEPTSFLSSTSFSTSKINSLPSSIETTSMPPSLTMGPSTVFPTIIDSVVETSSIPTTPPPTNFVSSSYFPTFSPLKCIYQVPNCPLCPFDAPLFDLTQGNVSCVFLQNEWIWKFTPNNGTLTNTGEIVVSGNTTILIQGNLINTWNSS